MRRLYVATAVLDYNGDVIGDAVLVERGVVAGVGPESRFPGVPRVRLQGYLTPGLVDAHLHLEGVGLALSTVDLRGSKSPVEVARRLASSSGPVALGRGWNQEEFESEELPERSVLDEAVPDRPAVAVRICGHMAVANTRALEETRPWERYPELVDKEKGLLYEEAVSYVVEKLKKVLDPVSLVERALEALADSGVYGASSMACTLREARALRELEARGALPLRVACYASRVEWRLLAGTAGNSWSVVGLKLFADGSLGARTAALTDGYSDDVGNRGLLLMDRRAIAREAVEAGSHGLRVAVHAIGDAALEEVLEAHRLLGEPSWMRVEHASVASPSQVARLGGQGLWVAAQPRFRVSDWWRSKRLGGRTGWSYRYRSMLLAGARLALSTDAPVEPHDPLETLRAATGLCGNPELCPEGENLRPREALNAYTLTAAHASGGPVALLGRLERGSPVALALFTDDPTSLTGLARARVKGVRGPSA